MAANDAMLVAMSVFLTSRERTLWLRAAVVLAAIYASAGFAGTLAGFLQRHEVLLGVVFGVGFVCVMAAVGGGALTTRPGRREAWTRLGVAAAFGTLVVRLGVGPLERSHLFEFGLLGVLLHDALAERRSADPGVPSPAVAAVVATAVLGWLDEAVQAAVPGRVYDLRDVGVNALAGFVAVIGRGLVVRARQAAFRARTGKTKPQETRPKR